MCACGQSELLLLLPLIRFLLPLSCHTQVDCVEGCLQKLVNEMPLIVLSVKTRKAARIMLEHYREEMETLAENVSLRFNLSMSCAG